MAKLILIRGLPGSGKSTLAKKMLKEHLADSHFEADMFFMIEGKYQFNPAKLKYAHEWCFENVRHALMTRNHTVVVSNTFTQKWEAERYLAMAGMAGIPSEIITCVGEYGSIHDIPEEAMQKMRERFVMDTSDWM